MGTSVKLLMSSRISTQMGDRSRVYDLGIWRRTL